MVKELRESRGQRLSPMFLKGSTVRSEVVPYTSVFNPLPLI